jgi:hypothetical protein
MVFSAYYQTSLFRFRRNVQNKMHLEFESYGVRVDQRINKRSKAGICMKSECYIVKV